MELEFIHKVIKSSLFIAIASALILSFFNTISGISFFFGALWGISNLYLLKSIVQKLVGNKTQIGTACLILCIKYPLLYYIGYLLLTSSQLHFYSTLIGSTLVFAMMPILWLLPSKVTKSILFFIPLLMTVPLHATLDAEVPEIPNIFTLIYTAFEDAPWAMFLHHWETLFFSILSATFISLMFYFGTRNYGEVPTRFQAFLEWIVELLRSRIAEVLGPHADRFVPFLGSLFLYILVMNWLVLIPLMRAPTSNFNITAALAICVFCYVQYLNIKNFGFFGFVYHLMGSPKKPSDWLLVPLMLPIELLTQLTRPVTLALRLFGNVVGEDILIAAFALFGTAILSSNIPVGVPLQIPFMFLAFFTALLQALVFTLLSTIYILLSMPHVEKKPQSEALQGVEK